VKTVAKLIKELLGEEEQARKSPQPRPQLRSTSKGKSKSKGPTFQESRIKTSTGEWQHTV
jgi:hypothetical protein